MAQSAAGDLAWHGVVEVGTVAAHHETLANLVRTGGTVRISLEEVERIDTAGWQLLLASARELVQTGGQLHLVGISGDLEADAARLGLMPKLAHMIVRAAE